MTPETGPQVRSIELAPLRIINTKRLHDALWEVSYISGEPCHVWAETLFHVRDKLVECAEEARFSQVSGITLLPLSSHP